jgi:hypothetical protein
MGLAVYREPELLSPAPMREVLVQVLRYKCDAILCP